MELTLAVVIPALIAVPLLICIIGKYVEKTQAISSVQMQTNRVGSTPAKVKKTPKPAEFAPVTNIQTPSRAPVHPDMTNQDLRDDTDYDIRQSVLEMQGTTEYAEK